MNFFSWYFGLFSDEDNKVRITAWTATLATLTFTITFCIKPGRSYLKSFIKKRFANKFADLEFKYSFTELKHNIRIIVIDDDDIFPVNGFEQFQYNISKWDSLDEQKLQKLREGAYDIIILDIWGVANNIAENDGLDVLLDLKSRNPAQVVVAYSGHSFDLSKNKFWELSDEKLSKPTPFMSTQTIIDELIERTFTVDYHLQKIKDVLNESQAINKYSEIEKLFMDHKKKNVEPDWIKDLKKIGLKNSDANKIGSIATKLFSYSIIRTK